MHPAYRWVIVAGLMMVAACSSTASPTTTLNDPSTIPSTAATTTTSVIDAVEVIPASAPPPWSVDLGTICAIRAEFGDPAESPYVLPFPAGVRSRVSQSYCLSRGSHANQLAYDFLLPIGAEVIAARGGEVVATYERAADGPGPNNYIFIEHDDGTVAMYAHLQENGVDVVTGQIVETGEHIATAGMSGIANSPHLHFGVYRRWPNAHGADLAINFRNARGPLDLLGGLLHGRVYEAVGPEESLSFDPIIPLGTYLGVDLSGSELAGSTLWGYDFTGSDLSSADLSRCDLGSAQLADTLLVSADLSYANLTYADLNGADLQGALLTGADLTTADLSGSDLRRAVLSGTYLAAADLTGADLRGAVLEGAHLIGVVADDTTRWPEGFVAPPQP